MLAWMVSKKFFSAVASIGIFEKDSMLNMLCFHSISSDLSDLVLHHAHVHDKVKCKLMNHLCLHTVLCHLVVASPYRCYKKCGRF